MVEWCKNVVDFIINWGEPSAPKVASLLSNRKMLFAYNVDIGRHYIYSMPY